ncbi:MAG: PhoH family protein [Desulfovibrio sp.]|nr:PhoH family protein [Desulfovibrio sp.]MBO4683863.1 PhoH family protein [Desulfovibrio sp.]MBR4746570.1 PhoH family protein [Desulfovibrio sp.]MBR5050407.1 PhoH family protein [Desulfovibrio sp.]MBR6468525.1 PhoH family protein [Desulfovibrio sp.]
MSDHFSTAELVEFDDPLAASQLFGPNNAHLSLLASASGAQLSSRGAKLLVDTPDARIRQALVSVFVQLYELFRQGVAVSQEDIARAYEMVLSDPGVVLSQVYRDAVFIHTPRKTVTARNMAQKAYLDALKRCSMVFAVGPAGTGKTYLAVAMALSMFAQHQVKRIVLTRPAVEAGERLGFLPGDLEEKVNPYLRPLYDALNDMLPQARVASMLESGAIEVAPLAFMRGRTLNDAFIILDEAQNTTAEQMKMFLTRMGFGSRMVVTGDPSQVDLPMLPGPSRGQSGLVQALQILAHVKGIAFHHFQKADVVRHPLVGAIVHAYDEAEARR